MKIVVTGHRPQHLTCQFSDTHPQRLYIEDEIRRYLRAQKAIAEQAGETITLYSGMALGVDQWTARIAHEEGIPFIAVVPCATQPSRWSAPQRTQYEDLLGKASKVIVLQDAYDAGCMERRNRWMVDQLDVIPPVHDHVLAVWNGKESGGTFNCVKYAVAKARRVERIDPNMMTHRVRAQMAMRELRAHITPELLDVLKRTQKTLRDVQDWTQNEGAEGNDGSVEASLWWKINRSANEIETINNLLERLATPR